MPVSPSYPGVYVQEVPSGGRTITGVSTSITAFIGYAERGPVDEPVRVFNFGEFEGVFGGLESRSAMAYGVYQYFQNGGTEALIVRAAKDASGQNVDPLRTARVEVETEGGAGEISISAANAGEWGNRLRVDVGYGTPGSGTGFNLRVAEVVSGEEARSEEHRNLTVDGSREMAEILRQDSDLLRASVPGGVSQRPVATGTVAEVDGGALDSSGAFKQGEIQPGDAVAVTVDWPGSRSVQKEFQLSGPGQVDGQTVGVVLRRFEAGLDGALEDVDGVDGVSLDRWSGNTYRLSLDTLDPRVTMSFGKPGSGDADLFEKLGLDKATANVQRYSLGLDPASVGQRGAEVPVSDGVGANGEFPGAGELKGSLRKKTGIYALEDADIFNLLCIPRTAYLSATAASAVLTQALDYCEENRAFMVVDPPEDKNEPEEVREWISSGWGAGHRHDHGAVYFPRVRIPDPENEFRPREVSPSGTVAGLYARTDTERGVWKAPAGTEATLQGVQSLEYNLSNQENGVLNPLGVNCLRTFPTYGTVSWGGRTLRGADQLADEYKYVPVRRTALYIEESLFRGLQWVVFEPNDESLWAQIRTSVQGFMQTLFRKGAFQGTSPKEAYFVKCDSETTTQADIDRGIVNIVVGFAPLKPAEFVILKIKQMAGQEQ